MATIENLDRLLSKLNKLANLNVSEPLTKACLLVENAAKLNAPVDKGQLRQSITHEIDGNIGVVGTNVEYAPYVEFGTGIYAAAGNGRQDRWSYQDAEGNWHSTIGQQPQPFLEPALESNRKEIDKIFKDFLKEGVSKNV